MNSASPFTTFFSDPLLPPFAGGPSEELIDFFPTASSSSCSFSINPNGPSSHQKPSREDQKWTDQQNWSYSFAPAFFDPTFDFNPPQPPFPTLDLSSGCTSPSSSRSSSFDASLITPISSSFPLFPSQNLDFYDNDHSPTPKSPQIHTPTSTVISTSSRGRKRVAPASFAEDDEDSSSSPRKLRSSKGKKVKEEDEEEDEGSDFDGSEEGGGSQAGRGGRRKGAKSIVDKKERRKATNRASAKAFRARRKNLLNDIQTQISERDAEIRDLQFLITRLRDEKSKILASKQA